MMLMLLYDASEVENTNETRKYTGRLEIREKER
jgi:hypothetical protein